MHRAGDATPHRRAFPRACAAGPRALPGGPLGLSIALRAPARRHAWIDDEGRQATDYALTAPENARYLAYYRQMGMSAEEAGAFYAMTNSVPFSQARWFGAEEMARWIALDRPDPLDLAAALH